MLEEKKNKSPASAARSNSAFFSEYLTPIKIKGSELGTEIRGGAKIKGSQLGTENRGERKLKE